MVQLNFEALYAAHPNVPRPVVRKIYEWKVSRDPDICPLYGNIMSEADPTQVTENNSNSNNSCSNGPGSFITTGRFVFPGGPSRFPPFPRYLQVLRRGEPIIITHNNHHHPHSNHFNFKTGKKRLSSK